ncbi:hypothetical protein BSAJGB5T_15845 [Bacillus safensis]|nr:hypothetical protein BSAJGB5T_15845 [Bacillus safensis]
MDWAWLFGMGHLFSDYYFIQRKSWKTFTQNKRKILLSKKRHSHFVACQNYTKIRFDKLTTGFNTQEQKNTLHYKLVSTFIMRYHLVIHMD